MLTQVHRRVVDQLRGVADNADWDEAIKKVNQILENQKEH